MPSHADQMELERQQAEQLENIQNHATHCTDPQCCGEPPDTLEEAA